MVREEVFNENLAQILEHFLRDVSAETIVYTSFQHKKKLPDIRISVNGVTVIIEARFTRSGLLKDAKNRVLQNLCDISIALKYPAALKKIKHSSQRLSYMAAGKYNVTLFHRGQNGEDGLVEVPLGDLTASELVQKVYDSAPLAISLSKVSETVDLFIKELDALASSLTSSEVKALEAFKDRVDGHLGISGEINFSASDYYYMTFFILANTMIFHQYLANSVSEIDHLSLENENARMHYLDQWERILKINYIPIFSLSYKLLQALPTDPNTNRKLNIVSRVASDIVSKDVTARHDFMGQIFTHFLAKSKQIRDQYASFYTSTVAGYLLSYLVCSDDFLERCDISKLKVLDPFSGSGTLLSNIYQQILAFYILRGAGYDEVNLLRKHLIEKVVYGWDVLPFASHLCLLTLALQSKDQIFDGCKIHTVGIGRAESGFIRLGSFEALKEQPFLPNIDFDEQPLLVPSTGEEYVGSIDRGPFDIIVMNPPYKRSAAGGKAFSFMTEDSRKEYQKEFSRLCDGLKLPKDQRDVIYNPAILLGMMLLKENGRVAFVLPKSFLSGGSSSFLRKILLDRYKVLFILLNSDKGKKGKKDSWNWSEDTDLGEIILVVEKADPVDNSTFFVNFRRKPESAIEASYALEKMRKGMVPVNSFRDSEDHGGVPIHISHIEQRHLRKHGLNYPAIFSSSAVSELLHEVLIERREKGEVVSLFDGLVSLRGMGTKEVRALFSESGVRTAYPVKWGHTSSDDRVILSQEMHGYGVLKAGKTTQQARRAYLDWAGELLVANRPQMKTKCVLACMAPRQMISTAFWACRFPAGSSEQDKEFVVLWLNSTLGLLMFLSASLHKKGELFEFKKAQAGNYWIARADLFEGDEIDECWKKCRKANFGLYKDDYVYLSSCNSESERMLNPRYLVDQLFIDRFCSEDDLKRIYDELALEPIFYN